MLEYQTDVWAVLCEPPEQLHKLVNDLGVSPELSKKFNTTSFTWNVIDSDEVIRRFRIACVEYAMVAAGRLQPTPAPDYWLKVENSCQQVINALNGTGDLDAAYAAAGAARAAADAAGAARAAADAARAAARAARAAADAARAAARADYADYAAADAARAAARAAYADYAARAAAREDLFETLIQIIFEEYENRG